ncbi:hypothetical protein F5Y18DRAFT_378377 [Xylariaceae sp. FL1019]|nr:hypothetical protein F5Y18DRAFT_378377 [Xylariaceae sp. FL1019]
MGWWNSLWASNTSPDDPLRKLDPKLREFLEKESPIKYQTHKDNSSTSQPSRTQPPSKFQAPPSTTPSPPPTDISKSSVPQESQFQDGRYADLWKSYKPLAQIEAETKSDHEKLMDVLEGFKERKAQIGKAALENCALEQVDWRDCMNNPSFTDRMTMCRDQVKKFEKCYMTQTRLLKALGYLSTLDRSAAVEEEIQLHADSLYHQMLHQESEIALARAEGRPIPDFKPVVARPMVPTTVPATDLNPEQQEALAKRLEKLQDEDKVAEEEAFKAELRAKQEVASRVRNLWTEQERERQERKDRGEETWWDKAAGAFGGSKDSKK